MRKFFTLVGAVLCAWVPLAAQNVLDATQWTDETHGFKGENYAAATNGDTWVNTLGNKPSWFSYDLSLDGADPGQPLYLACTFNNVDYKDNNRSTRIYVNDVLVTEQPGRPVQYNNNQSVTYLLVPAECWRTAEGVLEEKLTVRVESPEGFLSLGFNKVALVQSPGYTFDCTDWTSGDLGRLPLSGINEDTDNNLLNISCRGTQNDVALTLKATSLNKYTVNPSQKYLVVRGTSLNTSVPENSRLWWLNGRNVGSQVVPFKQMTTSDGVSYIVWDVTKTGLDGNLVGNPRTLTDYGMGYNTVFGLTSSSGDGKTAVISDIAFCSLSEISDRYPELAEEMEIARLDESSEDNDAVVEGKPVGVKRVMKPFVWNTFCVPFDMDAAVLDENGIIEVKKLSQARMSDDLMLLSFEKADRVEAGVPYIVKVGETVRELNADAAANVQNEPRSSEADDVVMKGNYGKMTIRDGQFFISNNMFYYADTDVSVKGFRAYLELPASSEVNINRMLIQTDDETTAIRCASGMSANDTDVDVYTLSGMRVKRGVAMEKALDGLSKGIYVVNGKKVVKF